MLFRSNLGTLDAFLRRENLRDNTIVVFMTDNGATAGFNVFNAGMRGRKQQYYEGGHRVPCFVRWPQGGLRKAYDSKVPAQMQDILPTLIDLCGLKKPASAAFDGQVPILTLQEAIDLGISLFAGECEEGRLEALMRDAAWVGSEGKGVERVRIGLWWGETMEVRFATDERLYETRDVLIARGRVLEVRHLGPEIAAPEGTLMFRAPAEAPGCVPAAAVRGPNDLAAPG